VSLVLTTAAVLFSIVRFECSRVAAVIAALAYLAAPVIAWFGQAGLHLHLALLATVAGLACFGRAIQSEGAMRRAWLAACLACFAVGAFTSWEPCLAAPGLVVAAACRRDMPAFRFAVAVGVVTTAVAVGVFALYWLSYPDSIHALFLRVRALFRAGLAGNAQATALLPPHALSDSLEPGGVPKLYVVLLLVRLASVGVLGLAGLWFAGRHPRLVLGGKPVLSYAIAGTASIALLWSVGMANHMTIHDYEALIFAPPAALAAGALMEHLRHGPLPRVLQWVPVAVLLALATREAATIQLLRENQHDTPLIAFARDVRASTEPNAVIVLPARDMVFVYYSRRHTIRGVMNEQVLREEQDAIFALCPACPVYLYLAVPLARAGGFPLFSAETPSRSFSGLGTLYRLRPDIR
jgi:4-amino-4-deoxy-L-arabinose transferase-like glycosyltransferase